MRLKSGTWELVKTVAKAYNMSPNRFVELSVLVMLDVAINEPLEFMRGSNQLLHWEERVKAKPKPKVQAECTKPAEPKTPAFRAPLKQSLGEKLRAHFEEKGEDQE